jgi:hypothetical protein
MVSETGSDSVLSGGLTVYIVFPRDILELTLPDTIGFPKEMHHNNSLRQGFTSGQALRNNAECAHSNNFKIFKIKNAAAFRRLYV